MNIRKTTENKKEGKASLLKLRPDRLPLLKTRPDKADSSAKTDTADTDPEKTEQQEEKEGRRPLLKTKPDRKPFLKTKPEKTITESEALRREHVRQERKRKGMQKKRVRKKKLVRMSVYVLIGILALLLILAVVAIVRRAKTSHEERIAEEAYQEEISNSEFFTPAEVLHLSFPVLTLDEKGSGLSVSQFRLILDDLYKQGYVLVDPYSLVEQTKDGFAAAQIMVPSGKKPMILSQYDVSYEAGDTEHAVNLQISPSGKISAGYISESGFQVSGFMDVVPILEDYLKEHPDFSQNNARGILGVTGYRGVLGYQVEKDTEVLTTVPIEETEQQRREREALEAQYDEYGYLYDGYDYGYTDDGYTTGDAGDTAGGLYGGAGLLMQKENTAFVNTLAKVITGTHTVYADNSGDTDPADASGDTDPAGASDDADPAGGSGDADPAGAPGIVDLIDTESGSAASSTQEEEQSEEDLQIAKNKKSVESVLSTLRDKGWRIASGSFGMVSYGSATDIVTEDAGLWQSVVAPFVGKTDMILLPGGADIGSWSGYTEKDAKYMLLKDQGFRYFFMDGNEALTWAQIKPAYVRQGMHMIPDYASYLSLMNGSEGSAVLVQEAAADMADTADVPEEGYPDTENAEETAEEEF